MDEQSPPYPMVGLLFFYKPLPSAALFLPPVNKLQFRIIQTGTPAYDEMISLRMKMLLGPIAIPRSYINPQKEASDLLLGVYEQDKLIGCCILTPLDTQTVQLRQMAVDTTVQKTGVGRVVLFFAESVAKEKEYKTMVMNARDSVLPFYQKCGYSIAGNQFYEVGIPHHKMHKILSSERG